MGSKGCSTEVESIKVEFHISREIPAGSTKSKVEAVGSGRHGPHRQSLQARPDHRHARDFYVSTKIMLQTETGIMIPSRREEVR